MIKSLIHASHLLPMVNQEGGAQPGEGLTAIRTFTYFVATPLFLFFLIGGLAWISSAPKKAKRDHINKIEDEDNNDFITMIS